MTTIEPMYHPISKHRASAPVALGARATGGAHRASRTTEHVITAVLGAILVVLLFMLFTR